MIIHNPILTGSLVFNGTNLTTSNLVTTGSNNFTGNQTISGSLFVTGSVGIGVNNPTLALEVSGGFKIQGPASTGIRVQASSSFIMTLDTAGGFVGGIGDYRWATTTGTNYTDFAIQANKNMGIFTNNSTTPSMYISSSSNVGIGTTTPTSRLVVTSDAATNGLSVKGAGNGGTFPFRVTWVNGAEGDMFLVNDSGNVGIGTTSPTARLDVAGAANFNKSDGAYLAINYSGSIRGYVGVSSQVQVGGSTSDFGLSAANSFTIATGGSATERLRILSGGSIAIGMTTAPYGILSIRSNGSLPYQGINVWGPGGSTNFISLTHTDAAGAIAVDYSAGGYTPLTLVTSNTTRMTIATNGSIGAPSGTNIYNASDVRLKQNVVTITDGLNKILGLNPVKFNWIDGFEPSEDGKDLLGFIAQEVQKIIPEAIEHFGGNSVTVGETTVENPLRVNEKFIIPVLVKAIQELKAEINELKNK